MSVFFCIKLRLLLSVTLIYTFIIIIFIYSIE
nr:MAG TPA: hypothetical protein [Caudoviricetes sp.]